MRKGKYIFFILIVMLVLSNVMCKNSNTSDQTLRLKIVSPYNCEYNIHVQRDKMSINSRFLSVTSSAPERVEFDTLVRNYDTLLVKNTNDKLVELIKMAKKEQSEISESQPKDAYVYELYLNDQLVKKKSGYDENIYSLIKTLRPYIKEEEIQCCGFFSMFDSIQN